MNTHKRAWIIGFRAAGFTLLTVEAIASATGYFAGIPIADSQYTGIDGMVLGLIAGLLVGVPFSLIVGAGGVITHWRD